MERCNSQKEREEVGRERECVCVCVCAKDKEGDGGHIDHTTLSSPHDGTHSLFTKAQTGMNILPAMLSAG